MIVIQLAEAFIQSDLELMQNWVQALKFAELQKAIMLMQSHISTRL